MRGRRWLMTTLRGIAATLALLAVRPVATAAQQAVPVSEAPSLYERLGGYDFIAKFVDTAFPRVASNPQLARLFSGHSVDSQMRQRQLIVDALCHETGGPCIYIGRDMTTVHEGLGITDADWEVFMGIIKNALTELGPPVGARRDLIRVFEDRLRPTVVLR